MNFKFNALNLTIASMFILAFVSLMLSYATIFMFYPATLFFVAGFVLLSVRLIKNYIKQSKDAELSDETIIMQLSPDADAETYVMQDDSTNKKAQRKKRVQKFDRLLPSIFSILAAVLFIYLFINRIIHH